MTGDNLLGVPETRLPAEPDVLDDLAAVSAAELAAKHPTSSLAWAVLADEAWAAGRTLESYAYARVGYHRGLDALRGAGWHGHGPIPWEHEPNRGLLRCLYALRRAAETIGEADEVARLGSFLVGADPRAIDAIQSEAAAPATPTEVIIIRGED